MCQCATGTPGSILYIIMRKVMCSSGTAKNIPLYSTGWHLWQADNVTIHHCEKEWQKNKLHYCNSVIILVCSHELDVWKNRVNWRVLCSYHATLRTWMSHFVSPTERLWTYDIIRTFCLIKLPQMLPCKSFFFFSMRWIMIHHQMFFHSILSILLESYLYSVWQLQWKR